VTKRVLVVCLALALPACALSFDAAHLGVPVSLAQPAGQPAQGTPFKVSQHATYLFYGALPVAMPSLATVVGGQVADGTGVADLRVKVRSRWNDLLVTVLTLGLVVPRTVTFEGVVVRR
jgi:hypothetical protein